MRYLRRELRASVGCLRQMFLISKNILLNTLKLSATVIVIIFTTFASLAWENEIFNCRMHMNFKSIDNNFSNKSLNTFKRQ